MTTTIREREYEVRLVHVQTVEFRDDEGKVPLVTRRPAHDRVTGAGKSAVVARTTVKAGRNIDAMTRALEWADKQMGDRSLQKISAAFVRDPGTEKTGVRIRAAAERFGTFPAASAPAPAPAAAPKRTPARRRSPPKKRKK